MSITAGRALAAVLEAAGIRHAFTVPGESFLELLDALRDSPIRVIAARHEAGAGFMAEAYAQLSGVPALCLVTRAVGAANLSIALHTAAQDSAPLVAIAGQVERAFRGREAFQEADLAATFGALCKAAAELDDPATVASAAARLVRATTAGRPGPVLLSIPEDVLRERVEAPAPAMPGAARGGAGSAGAGAGSAGDGAGSAGDGAADGAVGTDGPSPALVRDVLEHLARARRPVIVAGAGVLRARATDALRAFAEAADLPVVAAWRRPDVFPNGSPRYLGSTGLGAPATVRQRLLDADVLLALGTRLSEIATYGYVVPGPGTALLHVDVEPGFRGNRRSPDVEVRADAGAFLRAALDVLAGPDAPRPEAALAASRAAEAAADRAAFLAASELPGRGTRDDADGAGDTGRPADADRAGDTGRAGDGARADADAHASPDGGRRGVHPAAVIAALRRHLPAGSIVTTDAGNFAGWAARYLPVPPGGRFLGPTSGAMGYGLPAAIGAAIAARDLDGESDRRVIALAGDGGFAMLMAELETAVRERLRLAVIVFDNAMYGTIRAHQERAYPGRVVATDLGTIDLAAFARACGAAGVTIERDEDADAAVAATVGADGVTLLHVRTDPNVLAVDRLPG